MRSCNEMFGKRTDWQVATQKKSGVGCGHALNNICMSILGLDKQKLSLQILDVPVSGLTIHAGRELIKILENFL